MKLLVVKKGVFALYSEPTYNKQYVEALQVRLQDETQLQKADAVIFSL